MAAQMLRTFWSTVDVLSNALRSANLHSKCKKCILREKTEDVRKAVTGRLANWVILSLARGDEVT